MAAASRRRGSGSGVGGRVGITPEALGPAIARHLADPAVASVAVVHGGRLVVERIDGRIERPAPLPRGEADRIVAGLAVRLGRPADDRRPIVAEDPRADLAVAALASDGLAGAVLSAARIAPPRLHAWVEAGLLGGPEAARRRALMRDGANLVVAARAELARRQVVRTLLGEAAALGQRVLHVQGHERFPAALPGIVTVAAPRADTASRDGIDALTDRLDATRLVFPAPLMATRPWLAERAARRRPPCVVSLRADRPGRGAGGLGRPGGPAPGGPPAGLRAGLGDAPGFTPAARAPPG